MCTGRRAMAHAAWGLFAASISLTVGHNVFLKHVGSGFTQFHGVPFTIWGHRAVPVQVMPRRTTWRQHFETWKTDLVKTQFGLPDLA